MVQTPPRLPSQSPAMMQQQQQQLQQQQQQQPMQQQAMYPHAYMMPVSMAGLPPSNHMMAANGQQQARFTKRGTWSSFWNIFVTFQSQLFFTPQAFAGISLASSGRMARPLRSCDRLDDDHMTAVVFGKEFASC